MDQLGAFLQALTKPRYEEDTVDKLNYRITGYILLGTALTLTFGATFGKPIQCWVPAQWQGGWEEYAVDYCFVENTYWIPFERQIPTDTNERDKQMLNYYQWVPIVLALQALMMNIPHLIWRMLNWLSGIEVRAVVSMACNPGDLGGSKVDNTVSMIANHIRDGVQIAKAASGSGNPVSWFCSTVFKSSYVSMVYLMVKLMFVINLFLQFIILGWFLGTNYTWWGAQILFDLLNGKTWYDTGHFPRTTLCDMEVRQLGNLHRWTVQCVLMINMFSEKLYIFLWWWFLLVTVITVINAISWFFITIVPTARENFVREHLTTHNLPKQGDEHFFRDFMRHVLKSDGVLVLRLLANNAGDVMCGLVLAKMWDNFIEDKNKHKPALMAVDEPNDTARPVSI